MPLDPEHLRATVQDTLRHLHAHDTDCALVALEFVLAGLLLTAEYENGQTAEKAFDIFVAAVRQHLANAIVLPEGALVAPEPTRPQ